MTHKAKQAIKKARVWRAIPAGDIETIADGFLFLNRVKFIGKFTNINITGGITHSILDSDKRAFKVDEIEAFIHGLDTFYYQFSEVLKSAKQEINANPVESPNFSDEKVLEIRQSTKSMGELADEHSVAFSTIYRIKRNITHKNVGVSASLNKGE